MPYGLWAWSLLPLAESALFGYIFPPTEIISPLRFGLKSAAFVFLLANKQIECGTAGTDKKFRDIV